MARSTLRAVWGLPRPPRTLRSVATDTPACAAISSIVYPFANRRSYSFFTAHPSSQ